MKVLGMKSQNFIRNHCSCCFEWMVSGTLKTVSSYLRAFLGDTANFLKSYFRSLMISSGKST